MVDQFSVQVRSRIMASIRSKNTKPEVILRSALLRNRLKGYKLHYQILGSPDVAFPKEKLAIFVDGEFWHARDFGKVWARVKDKPFWAKKIMNNIKRDKEYNAQLKKEGWRVIRLWESDVMKDAEGCTKKIKSLLKVE